MLFWRWDAGNGETWGIAVLFMSQWRKKEITRWRGPLPARLDLNTMWYAGHWFSSIVSEKAVYTAHIGPCISIWNASRG